MADVDLKPGGTNVQVNFIYSITDLIKSNTSDYVVDSATTAHITNSNTSDRTLAITGTGLNTGSGVITGFDYKLNGVILFSVTGLNLTAADLDAVVHSYKFDQTPDFAALTHLFEGVGWNLDFSSATQFSFHSGTGGSDVMKFGSGTDFLFLDGGNDDIDLGGGDDVVYYSGDLGYRAAGVVHIDGGTGNDSLDFVEPGGNFVGYITEGMTIDLSGPIALPDFAITVENIERIGGTQFADVFIGTNAGEGMGGAGGGDELTGGGGKDTLYGSSGDEDVFIYLKASDSKGASRDIIMNYEHNMDFFDLSALHPDTKNDKFHLVHEDPLKKAGDLHFIQHNERGQANDYTLIEANIDKKGGPDIQIQIHGLVDLTGGDFAL